MDRTQSCEDCDAGSTPAQGKSLYFANAYAFYCFFSRSFCYRNNEHRGTVLWYYCVNVSSRGVFSPKGQKNYYKSRYRSDTFFYTSRVDKYLPRTYK